ncbi:MAG: hypothetical protein AAF513_19330 [Pseudomonadota bacterium]
MNMFVGSRGPLQLLFGILVLVLSTGSNLVLADVKRTASGKPDLSGVYDTGTLTPLNRPEEFGEHKFMTREQADQVVQRTLAAFEFANRESDPDRGAPKKGGDGNNTAGAGNVGGYNAFWIDPGSEANEVDGKFRTSIVYDPPNGRQPQRTRASLAKMAKQYKSFSYDNDGTASWLAYKGPGPFDGPESLAPSERCLISFSSTVPSLPSLYNNYKRIVQTETHVMILQEMVHDARVIRLDSEFGPQANRKWLGDSIGYWEGDTLVVHSRNFKATSGLPGADENLEVVERFNLREDGNLVYDFTVTDPTAWTAPWSGEYTWSASPDKVYEYACHEGNYAMGGILRGARILEKEWTGPVAGEE